LYLGRHRGGGPARRGRGHPGISGTLRLVQIMLGRLHCDSKKSKSYASDSRFSKNTAPPRGAPEQST